MTTSSRSNSTGDLSRSESAKKLNPDRSIDCEYHGFSAWNLDASSQIPLPKARSTELQDPLGLRASDEVLESPIDRGRVGPVPGGYAGLRPADAHLA